MNGAPWATDLDTEALEFNDGGAPHGICKLCGRPAAKPGGKRSPLNGLCDEHRSQKKQDMTAKRAATQGRVPKAQPDSALVAAARRVDQIWAEYVDAVQRLRALLDREAPP